MSCWSHVLNAMGADALVMQGARNMQPWDWLGLPRIFCKYLKCSFSKWWPFCLGLIVSIHNILLCIYIYILTICLCLYSDEEPEPASDKKPEVFKTKKEAIEAFKMLLRDKVGSQERKWLFDILSMFLFFYIQLQMKHSQLQQGAVSIRKTVLPGMAIPMLKIRRPNGRLIFNMEIAIRR